MKKLTLIPMLLAIMACSLFVPMSPAPPATDTLVPFPISPTETLMAVCTPPACRANETYFCNGDCPGGCGTVCATVTPDAAFAPLAAVDGAGKWIVRTEESLAFLDPAGVTSGFLLQRFYAPVIDFVLVRNGNIYSLTDTGDASLELRQVYPRERLIADLDTRRDVEGSPRIAPIFSSDGTSLVWSRADKDGTMTRSVFVTSLETGESREVWRTELPEEAAGHALVPIFYDEARQILVYALHTFYSGMTPTQVASLYLADVSTDTITPLWTLNPAEIYAGVSATVSADGRLLAYLTWGEPQADFTLPWTLHIRDLSNGYETTQAQGRRARGSVGDAGQDGARAGGTRATHSPFVRRSLIAASVWCYGAALSGSRPTLETGDDLLSAQQFTAEQFPNGAGRFANFATPCASSQSMKTHASSQVGRSARSGLLVAQGRAGVRVQTVLEAREV